MTLHPTDLPSALPSSSVRYASAGIGGVGVLVALSRRWLCLSTCGVIWAGVPRRTGAVGKLTSYTELNATLVRRTGLSGFDFSRADERAAMGHLLYLIVELNRPATGLMISALVSYLDANDAGSGFYGYAQDLGMLQRNASAMQKLEFWAGQVKALHEYYPARRPA
jgi:hypothetical protein